MQRTHGIARAAAATGALLVAGVFFASCALASAPGPTAPPAASVPSDPEASADPTPESATADPQPTESGAGADAPVLPEADHDTTVVTEPGPWTFESADGALRIDLPGGWTVAETVLERDPGDCFLGCHFITLLSATGTHLEFSDRSGDDAAADHQQHEEVERRTTPSGHAAVAGWHELDGEFGATVHVESRADGERSLTLWLADVPDLASAAEAQAFLAGPQAQEALAVMAGAVLEP